MTVLNRTSIVALFITIGLLARMSAVAVDAPSPLPTTTLAGLSLRVSLSTSSDLQGQAPVTPHVAIDQTHNARGAADDLLRIKIAEVVDRVLSATKTDRRIWPEAAAETAMLRSVDIARDGKDRYIITLNFNARFAAAFGSQNEMEDVFGTLYTSVGNLDELSTSEVRGGAELRFVTLIEGRPVDEVLHADREISDLAVGTAKSTQNTASPVVISAGHGWFWSETARAWLLQRPYLFGVAEDFINADFVAILADELTRSGTRFVSTREISRTSGTGLTGHPKWQEDARWHLKQIGTPSSVTDVGATDLDRDIDARPLYANMLSARALVSVHNNAGNATGTETWYCHSNSSAAESQKLANLLHRKVVAAIRAQYTGTWVDRGVKSAGPERYGENRLAQVPAALIEVAFMDTALPDNAALQDFRFKSIVSRALADAINEYVGTNGATDLDAQAQRDMDSATVRDRRFLSRIANSFGSQPNWSPPWQLRWQDYAFAGGRINRMFHATSATNPMLRLTTYYDPDTRRWMPWQIVQ